MSQHRIGVISDTHGLLRPEAMEALADSELIIHAGDVGEPEVLDMLRTIAPVIAVRGNIDKNEWAAELPVTEVIEIDNLLLYVLHDLKQLDLDPVSSGFSVVISGHTHQPLIERNGDVLYLNPGSAGPKRFSLPITVAELHVSNGVVNAQLIELHIDL